MNRCLIAFLLAALLGVSSVAEAALFRDEAMQRAADQGAHEELERLARARGGVDTMVVQLLLGQRSGGALPQLVQLAEQCVAQHPQHAPCHYMLGSVLALDLQRGGSLRAARLAHRVRDSFARALELDPQLNEARSVLQQIYLLLPALLGGSVEKARLLEQEARVSQPDWARLMRARLAARDDRWDEAERELLALRLAELPRSLQLDALLAWAGLARHWMKLDQHARARIRYESLAQQLPRLAQPVFQLGRILAAEGRHEEALAQYERARGLSGSGTLAIDYRAGIAWQDLGDKAKARALLLRFAASGDGSSKDLDDARKRLRELG